MDYEAQRRAAGAAWTALDAKRPPWAKALIVAELEISDCDPMSDYWGSHTARKVAIGWRSGSREDFRQLRKAAATFPETAHLGPGCDLYQILCLDTEGDRGGFLRDENYHTATFPTEAAAREYAEQRRAALATERDAAIAERGAWACNREEANLLERGYRLEVDRVEHRDNYSMGHGNWLGISQYSGWQVRSLDLGYAGYRSDVYEDHLPALETANPGPAPVAGVVVSENEEKNGVEIRFPAKPAPAVLDSLKTAGWRWSRFACCWYTRRTPEALAFARQLAS